MGYKRMNIFEKVESESEHIPAFPALEAFL